MKPEYQIREIKRYIITKHDEHGANDIAQAASKQVAIEIMQALYDQVNNDGRHSKVSILELPISTRVKHCLEANNILSTEELSKLTRFDLLKIPDLGGAACNEIAEAMIPFGGLRIRM